MGLTSSCDEGQKHKQDSTLTQKPPFTFEIITPVTSFLFSKAFSIFFQDFALLAFSLLTTTSPFLFSIFSNKTSIFDPTSILSISLVSLNSSIGIAPELFNPRSTKTNFFPISSIVPLVISPSLNFLFIRSSDRSFSNSL